uniref:Glycogenin glucosyltransferase n=1 Tax=Physcomitrium patens TaxID=3218 RepID=A0A2K1K330_PHYPA|nr:hypothetical protein PHYPA_012651 [Physcomitrium patens]
MGKVVAWVVWVMLIVSQVSMGTSVVESEEGTRVLEGQTKTRNAYATMLYGGTPRDYEFYVAARVLLQSLASLKANADLVLIASASVPRPWLNILKKENVTVKVVEDIHNPYAKRRNFEKRFKHTLNKIYAWTLTEYERVVMLDVDNVFIRAPDELFQCGEFCAAFLNPCIFHSGLFVLKPSNETFNNMLEEIQREVPNPLDGADQGFLTSYFHDLLDRPLFHPPHLPFQQLTGLYRLPQGYQMDAALYYLNLKWNVPCGQNSVITFPSIPMLKPWYWWSYPTLPLGILWHDKRQATIGQKQLVTSQEKNNNSGRMNLRSAQSFHIPRCHPRVVKAMLVVSLSGCYILPFLVVPTTVHPLLGWGAFFFGSFSLLLSIAKAFKLPFIPVLVPWLTCIGMYFIMLWPYHSNGISRSLLMIAYACISSPCLWWCSKELFFSHNGKNDEELAATWAPLKSITPVEFTKLC